MTEAEIKAFVTGRVVWNQYGLKVRFKILIGPRMLSAVVRCADPRAYLPTIIDAFTQAILKSTELQNIISGPDK